MTNLDQDVSLKGLLSLAGISVLVYALNRFLLVPNLSEPGVFGSYVGDFLALPVYLPLSFYLLVKLGIVDQDYVLKPYHILGAVLIFGVLFEGLLPTLNPSAIRDPWDILAYLLGGIVVYILSRYTVQTSA